MAFQLDTGVYSKQRSLSDYMAQNDARDLARAQAEQSIAASKASVAGAGQKAAMETVGLGLAGATPEDYSVRREGLIAKGVPAELLPEQYNKDYVDAVLTKTGYKAKPSLAEQLMQPLSMMMQQPDQMPTQEAAPVQPTGSISTSELQSPDQYQAELYGNGSTPQEAAAMESFAKGAPVGQGPMLPAQIPDTPMPSAAPNLQTTIPPVKTVGGMLAADKANAGVPAAIAEAQAKAQIENNQRATQPRTPDEQAKYQGSYAKAALAFTEAKRSTENLVKTAKEALQLLDSPYAGGWSSALGSKVPNSDAGALEGKIATIKANALVKALSNMRAASPTGGAVGNLSDKEGALLAVLEGALDTAQPEQLRKVLESIINDAPAVIAEREAALGQQFPDLYKPSSSNGIKPKDATNDPLGIR